MERFHSGGQQLCTFIATKETFYIRKKLGCLDWFGTPTWLPFHCFGGNTNMVDVTSCENGGVSKTFPWCISTKYRPSLNTTSKWPAGNRDSNKLFHKRAFDWLYSGIRIHRNLWQISLNAIFGPFQCYIHPNSVAYFHQNSWFYHASEAKQVIFRVYSIFSYSGIHSMELRVRFDRLFPFRLTKGKQNPIGEYMTPFPRFQRLRDKFVSYKKLVTNKLYTLVSSHDKTISR